MTARNEATERQVQAALPRASTWLAANAGSGKTRVLTDRVARLLLHGVPPEKVLCLTYTKAAASEMQNRLFERLGKWAMMPDAELADQLSILGEDPLLGSETLARARTLFARAIETPGGLKIQTIHSFCSSLLRRFPLEAGVSPQFAEIEDRAALLLREEIVDDMAAGPEAWRVRALADHLGDQDFSNITSQIASRRDRFAPPLDPKTLWHFFDLPPGFDINALCAEVFLGNEKDLLEAFCALLATGSSTDLKNGTKLATVTQMDAEALPILESVFLFGAQTKNPYVAKIGSVPTKALQREQPDLVDRVNTLMARIEEARPRRIALLAAQKTAALHEFASVFLPEYAARKERIGALDFDDLIQKARDLLSDPAVAEWILYRLDGGIDHILVDEAQDTSPTQWDVVDRLAREFTAGEGAREEIDRTIFVVGDKKQSIYSFQGADPEGFDRMHTEFKDRLYAVNKGLQSLALEHSFRSSSAILQVVDSVFEGRDGAGFQADGRHIAFKADLPGRVDLWPLVEPVDPAKDGDWTDPVDRPAETHHSVELARRIASQIDRMLKTETLGDGQGKRRRLEPRDIMILVQRRSALFTEIIRACKAIKLPIAGADRLKVGAELAVRDLAALLRFLDTPEDDLSLAEALKSPLFGWDEQMLYTLAQGRGRKFLWEALRERAADHPEDFAILTDLRNQSDFLRPYDLIERILIRHDGRRRLISRLGAEAEDGINAFLSQALGYERSEVPSLTGFLIWMDTDALEIKRQMNSSENLIRVMTVHGSKGLEAPIVILPETGLRQPPNETHVMITEGVPVWNTSAELRPPKLITATEAERTKRSEERQRLLYVAMTRAESWLIVAAAGKLDIKTQDTWYQQIETAMTTLGAERVSMPGIDGDCLRYSHGDWDSGIVQPSTGSEPSQTKLPALYHTTAPPAPKRLSTLSPSNLGGAKALPGSEGLDEDTAKQRGTAVHKLLEYLPETNPKDWSTYAKKLLKDIDEALRDEVINEAISVLDDPTLDEVFSPDTLIEVSLTATVRGHIIYGQIDRLIVSDDRVLAIDFKTNATVPAAPDAIPEGVLRQMGAYAEALAQIYPEKRIETAILWTRTAKMMQLPHDLVTEALHRALPLDALPDDT